jgi:hypothetical protein
MPQTILNGIQIKETIEKNESWENSDDHSKRDTTIGLEISFRE